MNMTNKCHQIETILGTINSKFKWAIAQMCYCLEMGYLPEQDFISCIEEIQESEPNEKWKDILSILKGENKQ